jgi:hypothetical protein
MQDNYQAAGNTQNLGCTANDVTIAHVTHITPISGITGTGTTADPFKCFSGSPIEFTADFEVDLGATGGARYDIGLYIAQNQLQALTGTCNSSIITSTNATNYKNLDSSPDTCGDISGKLGTTFNPQFVHLDIVTTCTAGANSKLLLPNCTSWRQPGSNEVCQSITDAFPGSPSKCNCDNNFTIDVTVEKPTIGVTKKADPSSLKEPGGDVLYTVTVTNNGTSASVTLNSIVDDPDNNSSTNNSVTYTPIYTGHACPSGQTCAVCDFTSDATGNTVKLAPSNSTKCTFTVSVSGQEGDTVTDRACVNGTDSNGGAVGPTCANASVSITEADESAAITKTVKEAVCAVVRYDVKVDNNSTVDTLTLKQLCDDKVGDISQGQNSNPGCTGGDNTLFAGSTCILTQDILAGSSYSCTFDALVCAPFPSTDTVSGLLSDKDGGTDVTPSTGSATVNGVTVTTP